MIELQDTINSFMGKGKFVWWIGVVEDTADPLTLGRVRVRCFGFHDQSREAIPTISLPWATVVQPTTSASTSGVGWSPNGLERDSWVMGFFADGEEGQYPIVIGSIPRVHRGAAGNDPYGGSDGRYLSGDGGSDESSIAPAPYHGQPNTTYGPDAPQSTIPDGVGAGPIPTLPQTSGTGEGATIKDDGSYLTKANISNWPLKYYTWKPAAGNNGLACKDGQASLRFHKSTALALEELSKRIKGGPFRITSAYRTAAYNATRKGAAKGSMHIQGRALDVQLGSIGDLSRFLTEAVKCGFTGFGLYPGSGFVHIDTGKGRTWNAATQKYIPVLRKAGWYPGKPGLSNVKTTPGQADESAENTVSDSTPQEGTVDTGGSAGTAQPSGTTSTPTTSSGAAGATPAGSPSEDAVVRTILAEAQTEGPRGMQAVANVIKNRSSKAGITPYSVVSEPAQFTGFGDPRYRAADPNSAKYQQALEIWRGVNNGTLEDITGNADHYHADYVSPKWKNGVGPTTAVIGRHIFYNSGGAFTHKGGVPIGFQDPTGAFPSGGYKGQPSTHEAARGLNSGGYVSPGAVDTSGETGAYPIAGDKGTFGSPDSGYAPQYPYNRVYASKTGHMLEFDDTPGASRVALKHKSGSKITITENGSTINEVKGNHYNMVSDDSYNAVNGSVYMTAKDDVNIRATSDIALHADGAMITISRNDNVEQVSGKKDIHVGEVLQIKANKVIIEASQFDFYSTGNMNFHAEGDINMKAGGKMKMTGATTHIFGSTVYMDDVVKACEGATEKATDAASADLGKVRTRATVQKIPQQKINPDSHVTTKEALEHYGSQSTKPYGQRAGGSV